MAEVYLKDRETGHDYKNPFRPGTKLTLTSGRYCLIERDPARRVYKAVKIDGALSNLLVGWALFKSRMDIINYRLLQTAHIWGLLSTPDFAELKWSDLKILKREKNG